MESDNNEKSKNLESENSGQVTKKSPSEPEAEKLPSELETEKSSSKPEAEKSPSEPDTEKSPSEPAAEEYNPEQLKQGYGRNEFARQVGNKDYYKQKGEELKQKQEQARMEKDRKWKNKDPNDKNPDNVKADGSDKVEKKSLDKLKDDANLAKAKLASAQNKINEAKSKAYKTMHPIEAAKAEAKAKIKKKIGLFMLSHPWIPIAVLGVGLIAIAFFTIIIAHGSSNNSFSYGNGLCASNSEGSILDFINGFEGAGETCTTSGGVAGYKAKNYGDGTYTVGYGVTNHLLGMSATTELITKNNWGSYFHSIGSSYYVSAGDCIPQTIIDSIKLNGIENVYYASVENASRTFGIELTPFEKDALVSFSYNLGTAYIGDLLQAYKNGGYEALWNEMSGYVHSNGETLLGLQKRRKAEFALFVTGDYTDQGLFYSRSINDYQDYDSEGVMARQMICANGGSSSGFLTPLSLSTGFSCTSPYGNRIHPITKKLAFHSGLDLGVGKGTPIYASKSGIVTLSVNNPTGCGSQVSINHQDGTSSSYCHMTYNSMTVKEGQSVNQGDVIGLVGSTGASTGNHLHFMIYVNGTTVDPYDFIDLSGVNGVCKNY